MMLQAFPSAQSSITADSAKVYLFAVEEMSLEALKRACRRIVRGDVKDLKADFPPSAPRLAQVVEECEARLKVEQYEASRVFLAEGSELWQKMRLLRNDPIMPTYDRTLSDGTRLRGWFFEAAEVGKADQLQLPPPIPEADMEIRRKALEARLGFSSGDIDAEQDAA